MRVQSLPRRNARTLDSRHMHRQWGIRLLPCSGNFPHCIRLECRSVRGQARGVADRAKLHETTALLRLECRLPHGGELSSHVGAAHG